MEKLIGKFYGLNKIKAIKSIDRKTARGNTIVELEYEDDKKEEVPESVLIHMVTPQPLEPNDFVGKMAEPIVLNILEELLENEVKLEHIKHIFSQVQMSIDISVESGANKLWKKDFTQLTFADVDKVLKS